MIQMKRVILKINNFHVTYLLGLYFSINLQCECDGVQLIL